MAHDVLVMDCNLFFTGDSQMVWSVSFLLVNINREELEVFILEIAYQVLTAFWELKLTGLAQTNYSDCNGTDKNIGIYPINLTDF